jgi:hypothetical protein
MAADFTSIVMNQTTVGTTTTVTDVIIFILVITFMLFVMYLGNKMNSKILFKESVRGVANTAYLMKK